MYIKAMIFFPHLFVGFIRVSLSSRTRLYFIIRRSEETIRVQRTESTREQFKSQSTNSPEYQIHEQTPLTDFQLDRSSFDAIRKWS